MKYQIGRCDYSILGASSLVLITGNTETALFSREISDAIKQKQTGELWVCETLSEFEERSRYPAFLGRWWYTGSADRLSTEDKRAFSRLVKKPTDFGTAVLTGIDFTKYKDLTRELKRATKLHEVMTSFPSRLYLVNYVQQAIVLRNCKISQGAAESFIWRLGDAYSKYDYYIDRLVYELPESTAEVTIKHINSTLKGVSGASFDDFLKYLMRPLSESGGELKRTTKLFKSYRCMIEDGAAKTLRRLHNKALQYLEIRRLINEGYLPVAIEAKVANLSKLLGEPPEEPEEPEGEKKKRNKFTRWDLLQWSDVKLRREIEVASQVPLADWYTVSVLSARRCTTDEEAERVFYDILTRSRITSDTLI